MTKINKFAFFTTICVTFLKSSSQIYVPDDQINQKPITYTSGIKTSSFHRPSQIQLDHNYSNVYHQSNHYPQNFSQDHQRLYPIYNAHTYGSRPPNSERLTQVYILNGTRIRKNENPTRKIAIYNKQKRTPPVEIYRACPKNATGQFVYETSCNQFLNCWKGRGYVQNCAPGTLFNPKTLECDFPEKVFCISGPRQTILRREKSASVRQIGCPKEFSGLIPNYTDCSKFINCVSGIENLMDCPPGTLFDINKNICDFAHKATCFNGQNQRIINQNIDGKLDFSTQRTHASQIQYRDNEIRCPDGVNGLYRHPTQCSKFLNCANGQTYVQDCAPGTVFNPSLKICDFPYNVRCENKTPGINIIDYDAGYYVRNNSLGSSDNRYNDNNQYSHNHQSQNGYNVRPYSSTHGESQYSNTGDSGYYSNSGNTQYNRPSTYDGSNRQPSGYSDSTINTQHNSRTDDQNSGYYDSTINTQYNRRPIGPTTGYYDSTINTQYSREPVNQNSGYYGSSSNVYDRTQYSSPGRPTHYPTEPTRHHTYVETNDGWNQNHQNNEGAIDGHYSSTPSRQQNQNAWGQGQYGTQYGKGTYSGTPYSNSEQNSFTKGRQETYGTNYGTDAWRSRPENTQHGKGTYSGTHYSDSEQNSFTTGRQETYGTNYGTDPWRSRPENTQTNWGTHNNQENVGTQYRPSEEDLGQYPSNNGQVYPLNQKNKWQHSQRGESGYTGQLSPPKQRPEWQYGRLGESDFHGRVSPPNQRQDWQHGQRRDNSYNVHVSPPYQPQHTESDETTSNRWYDQRDTNQFTNQNRNNLEEEEGITSNYDQVVNINQVRKTTVPFRNSYEPFFGPTTPKPKPHFNDYDDTFGSTLISRKYVRATTPRIEKSWPPPFPSTDVNADYVFEYEDGSAVTLEAENSVRDSQNGDCAKSDFRCSSDKCISKNLVCNSFKDCPNGQDELHCLEYVSKFAIKKNNKLAVLEKERWDNVSIATCALLCIQAQKLHCRSFNYRKIDKTCFLTNTNEGLTGAVISYYPFDYYELISEKINCNDMYVCENKKCIDKAKICDGQDDCGDRMDEKGCKAEAFGYSVKLTGSKNRNEGSIQVTAFGKTGYICDDTFGLRDANVVCKELGFHLGAIEVKKNSFFSKNLTTERPFYMMDDVSCVGNETKLMDCDFNGWGVHNCLGQEIVGVVCKTPQEKCPDEYWQCDTGQECLPLAFVCDGLLDCSDGSDEGSQHCDAPTEVRLVNGSSRQQGRVEIRHHGIWGTICDDDFNEDAAKVVCRQLGYKGSATVKKDAFFGSGSGPIWLDQVFCSGNETTVERCTHWNWGEHNCEHNEDVGVVCSNEYEYERHSMVPMPKVPQVYPHRCGLRNDNIFNRDDEVHFRVVRGSIAHKGDYPWQAAIRVKGKSTPAHWCGAVIISEKFVLTAAHCLIGYAKGAYIVVAGDYNVDEIEGTEQEAYIEDFYLHENFRQGHKMNNDIALIKLKGRGFRLNDDVQAICLPDADTSYEMEQNCTISGFGSVENGKSAFSHNLRAGWVPLQKREICSMPHVYGDALTEGMVCAGSLDEGVDSCDGDSGGPLACLNRGVFTLYGITSWGQHCGFANKPGVYVKVAHYRKWIDDTFRKYSAI